jgi:hypothetical protein
MNAEQWARLRWETPDEPISRQCSLCGHSVTGSMPLRLTRFDGFTAQFCDDCQGLILADEGEP